MPVTEHRIADISFSEGTIDCTCSAHVQRATEPHLGGRVWPADDPDQPLIDGWNDHRTAMGLRRDAISHRDAA